MSTLLLNLILTLIWVALTGQFAFENFAFGFAIAYLLLWLTQRPEESYSYFRKIRQVLGFAIFALWQIAQASLQVAYMVLRPGHQIQPGVIAIPLDARTDEEITLLANLITLTPGTLSLDVSSDRLVLYVHTMHIGESPDRFRKKIKEGFERRVLEVLR